MSVLIIDSYQPLLVQGLQAAGIAHHYLPGCTAAQAEAALPQAEVLVLRSKLNLQAHHLAQAAQLRLVVRTGAGTDHIDAEALQQAGIRLVSTPGANAPSVGEHTLGLMLALLHHIARAHSEVRQGQWRRHENMGEELGGKTVGLLGYGHTGQAVARRLAGMNVRVLAYDKYRSSYGDAYATQASLQQLQAEADVLSLHIPLEGNRHFVNEDFLAGCAQPLWLINASRGSVLDTAALIQALQQGHIRGAALDVLENEDLHHLSPIQQAQFSYLSTHPQVVLTPHIAGWSHQTEQTLAQTALRIITDYFH